MQKMDVVNIIVVVCISNAGVSIGGPAIKGGEFFRVLTERARELLMSIK